MVFGCLLCRRIFLVHILWMLIQFFFFIAMHFRCWWNPFSHVSANSYEYIYIYMQNGWILSPETFFVTIQLLKNDLGFFVRILFQCSNTAGNSQSKWTVQCLVKIFVKIFNKMEFIQTGYAPQTSSTMVIRFVVHNDFCYMFCVCTVQFWLN